MNIERLKQLEAEIVERMQEVCEISQTRYISSCGSGGEYMTWYMSDHNNFSNSHTYSLVDAAEQIEKQRIAVGVDREHNERQTETHLAALRELGW